MKNKPTKKQNETIVQTIHMHATHALHHHGYFNDLMDVERDRIISVLDCCASMAGALYPGFVDGTINEKVIAESAKAIKAGHLPRVDL